MECSHSGPRTRQAQPWGLKGCCDACWSWHRANAWRLYRAARRAGTLAPPAQCQDCGRERKIIGHHTDYRRPFMVAWLCATCHSRAHKGGLVATGRCSGCGASGTPKRIRVHVRACEKYRDLLRSDPDRALEPEAEHERWIAEDRAAERGQRREQLAEVTDAKQARQRARFATPPDILE